MRTIAIVNRKGGTGKTTTTIELAHILATICRKRVLVIDLDSQANATSTLLGERLTALLLRTLSGPIWLTTPPQLKRRRSPIWTSFPPRKSWRRWTWSA